MLGQHLKASDLDMLNEEQLGQLLELKLETRKPLDDSVLGPTARSDENVER